MSEFFRGQLAAVGPGDKRLERFEPRSETRTVGGGGKAGNVAGHLTLSGLMSQLKPNFGKILEQFCRRGIEVAGLLQPGKFDGLRPTAEAVSDRGNRDPPVSPVLRQGDAWRPDDGGNASQVLDQLAIWNPPFPLFKLKDDRHVQAPATGGGETALASNRPFVEGASSSRPAAS